MSEQELYTESHRHVHFLPAMDWNVKFYGAHRQQVRPGWTMPKESHIGFEIIVLLEGAQETVMENSRYLLEQGDMILIPPGCKHTNRCISEKGMTYFCAHFSVDDPLFRQQMVRDNHVLFPAGTEHNESLRRVLDQWIEMADRQSEYTTADRFRPQALLFELMGVLARMVSRSEERNEYVAPTSVQYAKAIAEAIKARFDPHAGVPEEKSLRIEELIASIGISPGYGLEVFRKVYGISPRQYLSELKLNEAKVLIGQPELPLKEVASILGYSHLSHFSRQFKRWTGMSPMQYRQSLSHP
ncbi:AraC family transcriptional regulator [Paenibacillus sp. P26]|nr:AraC family transcriptional regulator [Paenibacillus sp. P26]